MIVARFASSIAAVLLVAACASADQPPVEPAGPVPVAAKPPPTVPAPAASPPAESTAPPPGTLPDGSLPTLAGAAPDAGLAVAAGGVVDWLPAVGRVRDDARTSAPWIASFTGEASARWSLAPALEVQGIVIDGTVELVDEAEAAVASSGSPASRPPPRTLGRWSAFRAPGGAVTLRAQGGAAARVVLFAATRDGSPVGAILRDPEAGPAPRKLPAGKGKGRPMPLEVVDLHDRAALRWGAGKLEARIAWDGKEPAAALDVIVFAPDAAVGEHAHPGAWECLLPLRVAGEVIVDGKPQRVIAGVPTCIPPDVKHAWKPAGTEPLIAIQVYAPAGAEQRFRDLAAKAGPAPVAPAR